MIVALASLVGYLVMTRIAGTVGAAVVSTGAYVLLLACGLTLIRRGDPFPWRALIPIPEIARVLALVRRAPRQDPEKAATDGQPPSPPAP